MKIIVIDDTVLHNVYLYQNGMSHLKDIITNSLIVQSFVFVADHSKEIIL
jgi:hypothetical protein